MHGEWCGAKMEERGGRKRRLLAGSSCGGRGLRWLAALIESTRENGLRWGSVVVLGVSIGEVVWGAGVCSRGGMCVHRAAPWPVHRGEQQLWGA